MAAASVSAAPSHPSSSDRAMFISHALPHFKRSTFAAREAPKGLTPSLTQAPDASTPSPTQAPKDPTPIQGEARGDAEPPLCGKNAARAAVPGREEHVEDIAFLDSIPCPVRT